MVGRLGVLVVLVAAWGCSGKGGGGTDGPPVHCCPMDETPSCECTAVGGRIKDGTCGSVCDSVPVGWVRSTDDAGCPVWFPNMNDHGCLPRPLEDGGTDGHYDAVTLDRPPDAPSDDGRADAGVD